MNNQKGCEKYPHENMDEHCKKPINITFALVQVNHQHEGLFLFSQHYEKLFDEKLLESLSPYC